MDLLDLEVYFNPICFHHGNNYKHIIYCAYTDFFLLLRHFHWLQWYDRHIYSGFSHILTFKIENVVLIVELCK